LILEPGSAIAWQTGFLLSTVRDLIPTPYIIHAMLDVSFTAHMPDCLEMPYRPIVRGERQLEDGEKGYRLGGASCLAGDFLGDFAFPKDLSIGDRVNQPRADDDPTSDDPEADFASAATEATILFAYVLVLCVACAVLSWVPPFA
jgi:hypothetical protein